MSDIEEAPSNPLAVDIRWCHQLAKNNQKNVSTVTDMHGSWNTIFAQVNIILWMFFYKIAIFSLASLVITCLFCACALGIKDQGRYINNLTSIWLSKCCFLLSLFLFLLSLSLREEEGALMGLLGGLFANDKHECLNHNHSSFDAYTRNEVQKK